MPEPASLYPAHVLSLLSAQLPDCGVSRVAARTGLDITGIQVAAATRPLAASAVQAYGGGVTLAAAMAEAALAAIALRYAEAGVPPAAYGGVPADSLEVPFELAGLALTPGSLVTPATPLDWITARPAGGGPGVLVPRDLVRLGRVPRGRWRPGALTAAADGLAADLTRAAAVSRALCDIAAGEAAGAAGQAAVLDLASAPGPWTAQVLGTVAAAGGTVSAAVLPAWPGLACFSVRLWLPDTAPLVAEGTAARPDPGAALGAAIAEAGCARLELITGGGGVLTPRRRVVIAGPPDFPGPPVPWADLPSAVAGWPDPAAACDQDTAVLRSCAAAGAVPLAADLCAHRTLAVVKVLAARHGAPAAREAAA